MSVGTFDPNAGPASLDVDTVKALLAATEKAGVEALDAQQVQEFAPLITADWSEVAPVLASAEIESLIHVFTLGEAQYVAWTADVHSFPAPFHPSSELIHPVSWLATRHQYKRPR